MLLAKSKLNCIEFLISKASIDSVISDVKFLLVNNMLKIITKWKKKLKI